MTAVDQLTQLRALESELRVAFGEAEVALEAIDRFLSAHAAVPRSVATPSRPWTEAERDRLVEFVERHVRPAVRELHGLHIASDGLP